MTRRAVEHPPRPTVAIAHRPLDERWSRYLTIVTELVVLAIMAVLLTTIAFDVAGPARAVSALCMVIFVPGWTVCRVSGWRFSASTLLTSFGVSVAMTALVGQVSVTRTEWPLEAVGVVLGCVCLGVLGVTRVYRWRRV